MKTRTEIEAELFALLYEYENNDGANSTVKVLLEERIKTLFEVLNGECDEELVNRAIRIGIVI